MVPHTPEQNGVAERVNRKILDKGRTILKDANTPNFLWADAFATAVYAINQTVSVSASEITPYEAFFGKKPTIAHMRVWYSEMFIHHPKSLSSGKLRECSQLVRFLGYPENSAGYRAFDLNTHKVSVICLPLFREEARPTQNMSFEMPGADYSSSEEAEDVLRQQSKVDAPSVTPTPTV